MNRHDPYAALRLPGYRLYFAGNLVATLGYQMQVTAIGWDIYLRTQSKLALGIAGLVQFLPVVLLFLLAGHAADRFNRKAIVGTAMATVACASAGLAGIAYWQADWRLIFVSLMLMGTARVFQQPAKSSLLPLIVPPEHFANAVTWNTSGFHLASVVGPAIGGLLIAVFESPTVVYLLDVAASAFFLIVLFFIPLRQQQQLQRGFTATGLLAGFEYVWSQQVILGAIALDMFAVLLGGAVTLLPVYAEDILQVGPQGLGWLRTAPALGAFLTAMLLAHRPPIRRTGRVLLAAVAGFGVATIVFGVSRSFALSLAALFLTGAFDNVSVVIRHTLVQTLTPDHLRGRVSAVNSLFIGASNELGGFESGVVAHWFGPTVSVVSGGVGTLVVVLATSRLLPGLRHHTGLTSDRAGVDDQPTGAKG